MERLERGSSGGRRLSDTGAALAPRAGMKKAREKAARHNRLRKGTPLASENGGFGQSHGYGRGHGGPSSPGDVPADDHPTRRRRSETPA
jgi:hypothetical protein